MPTLNGEPHFVGGGSVVSVGQFRWPFTIVYMILIKEKNNAHHIRDRNIFWCIFPSKNTPAFVAATAVRLKIRMRKA